MWVRTIKITFANELMKNSVRLHLSETIDLTEDMLLVYRVDLAANVSLVNHFFPSEEALENFSEKLKPVREQLKAMGLKSRLMMDPFGDSKLLVTSHWTCFQMGWRGIQRNNHFHTLIRVTPHRHHSPHHIM